MPILFSIRDLLIVNILNGKISLFLTRCPSSRSSSSMIMLSSKFLILLVIGMAIKVL